MATRKATENKEESTKKRRRVVGGARDESSFGHERNIASFDDMNEDCVVKILSYLLTDDMDNVAIMNRLCRDARRNESLDQTRTGTIVCSERTSIHSIYNAIITGEWNMVFSGNRTHLRIENISSIHPGPTVSDNEEHSARLTGVTSLDLSCSPDSESWVNHGPISNILGFLPNLREIDISGVRAPELGLADDFQNRCPNLACITATNSKNIIHLSGWDIENAENLTELYLDGALVRSPQNHGFVTLSFESADLENFLFRYCGSLQRLSIKNTTWAWSRTPQAQRQPISQNMLMKMVKRHQNLRWLRSDLSEENIEILKRERPEITFVS